MLSTADLTACNACDGVVGCSVPNRLGVSGQIVDRQASGTPVSGVRIDVIRTGGGALDADSASATTDGQGWWQVSFGARDAAPVTVDVVVTPAPPAKPYRVTGLQFTPSTVRGEGSVLGRWVTEPFISYIGELRDRQTGEPIAGARVTYVRRGGIDVQPTPSTTVVQTTTSIGYFFLDLKPAAFAPLVADFIVERPGVKVDTIQNVSIMPGHEWGPPLATAASSFRLGVGFDYYLRVVNRATGQASAGWFTWQRTGGIAVTPNRVQLPSGINNVMHWVLTPATAGTVVGDAFFEPAGTRDTVYFRGLQVATYEAGTTPTLTLSYGVSAAAIRRARNGVGR